MAAGKSTVGEMLAHRFAKGVHVRGHAFHRMVVSGREEMTAHPSPEAWRQLRLRYQLGAAAADTYFAAGFSVVVQDIVIGPLLHEYVEAITSRPLVVVVLAPRPDVVARREEERAKTGYAGGLTPQNLDETLRTQSPRVGLWLDSSDQTLRRPSTPSSIVPGTRAGSLREQGAQRYGRALPGRSNRTSTACSMSAMVTLCTGRRVAIREASPPSYSMVAQARDARPGCAGTSIPPRTGSCSSTSADPGGARRTPATRAWTLVAGHK